MPPPPTSRLHDLPFLDPARLDAALERLVPDPADRAHVLHCILAEGPAHHRGATWVLLALLVERAAPPVPSPDDIAVPMRLPPHIAERTRDACFPLAMPRAPLHALAPPDSRELDAMVECLLDGPPHHALANALMVALIGAIPQKS